MTWIQTHSGVAFDLASPQPELVVLEDIAVALSRINRFNGHTIEPYSVAQHSVEVSRLVPHDDAAWGLMHDAAEAYIGDCVSPLKGLLGGAWGQVECRLMAAIVRRFGLEKSVTRPSWDPPQSVKRADLVMLATEKRDLMGPEPRSWVELPDPRPEPLCTWSERTAYARFLNRAAELGIS